MWRQYENVNVHVPVGLSICVRAFTSTAILRSSSITSMVRDAFIFLVSLAKSGHATRSWLFICTTFPSSRKLYSYCLTRCLFSFARALCSSKWTCCSSLQATQRPSHPNVCVRYGLWYTYREFEYAYACYLAAIVSPLHHALCVWPNAIHNSLVWGFWTR